MASVNSCTFIGNIGKIDTRFLSSGDAVTNFSLACSESWKDKNGEKIERTEWVSCVAYKKLAEIMEKYCQKGMQIYIHGRQETKKYTDKNGVEKYLTQIIVNDMKMLGKAQNDSQQKQQSKPTGTGFESMEDDIPF